jgi:hypothetical protein
MMAKSLIVIGAALVLLGGLLWLASKTPLLGRLPGDIRIERPAFTCLIPIASSIVISILLTLLLNVIARLINR